jgi:hypothetical protein
MGPVSLVAAVNRCLTLPTLLQWLAQERNWVPTRGSVAGMLGIVSGALFLRSNGPAQLYWWLRERLLHVNHVRYVWSWTIRGLSVCRSGFTTLPPVPLLEQHRCGSIVGGAQITRGVGYQGIWWTRRFTWFGLPERNTLRPRVKGVVLMCLSVRLRNSLFSPSVRASVWSLFVPCDCCLPGPFIAQGRAVTG